MISPRMTGEILQKWLKKEVGRFAIQLKNFSKIFGEGKILALCHGKAEFGARALGFRSIIADPRDLDTIRRINMTVKMRDFWMPLHQQFWKVTRINT